MLFITNREPQGPIDAVPGSPYKFDLKKNSPSNSVYYCERTGKNKYTEIGGIGLMAKLKESQAEQLLFFIHGFSNLPEPDIFPRAAKLQKLFDNQKPGMMLVVPIIWPCDNDMGVVKDYWDDQKSADLSAYSFARVLGKFLEWRDTAPESAPCLKRMNVLAHSMGNRVFRETLSKWNQYDLAGGVPLLFKNVFLVAADVVNETLEEPHNGRLISQAARNVSVYFASDDLALRASKVSNLKNKVASRRLGHTGPENMGKVQTNVYEIDCDNFNNEYDHPKGHTYFLEDAHGEPGRAFMHMFDTLETGRVHLVSESRRLHIL